MPKDKRNHNGSISNSHSGKKKSNFNNNNDHQAKKFNSFGSQQTLDGEKQMHIGQNWSQFEPWWKTYFQSKSKEAAKEMFDPEFTADKEILDDPNLADYTEDGEDPTIIQLETWKRDSNNIARKNQLASEHNERMRLERGQVIAEVLLKCDKKLNDAILGSFPDIRDSQDLSSVKNGIRSEMEKSSITESVHDTYERILNLWKNIRQFKTEELFDYRVRFQSLQDMSNKCSLQSTS